MQKKIGEIFFSIGTAVLCLWFAYAYFSVSKFTQPMIVALIACSIIIALGFPFLIRRYVHWQVPRWAFVVLFLSFFFAVENAALGVFASSFLRSHPWSANLWTAWHLLWLVGYYSLFSISTFLIGDLVLVRLLRSRESVVPFVAMAIVTGLTLVAIYYYALALLGFVYPIAVAPPLALAVCNRSGTTYLKQFMKDMFGLVRQRMPFWSSETLWYGSAAMIGAFLLVQNGWPVVVERDSLAHYFNLPYTILQQHALVQFPFWSFGDSVIAFSFIYLPILSFGQALLNHASLYFFILSLPLVFCWLHVLLEKRSDVWLALWLYLTIPLNISWLLLSPKIDFLNVVFIMATVVCLVQPIMRERARFVLFAGILAGFAIAIKFNAILVLSLIYGTILVCCYRRDSLKKFIWIVLVFTVGLVLAFGFWTARTYYYHHDFLYPYSGMSNYKIHTTVTYSPADEQYMNAFMREADYYNAKFGFSFPLWQNIQNFFSTTLTYPSFNYGLVLMLAALALLYLWRFTFAQRMVVIATCVIVIAWYELIRTEAHYIDFLMPAFALMGALTLRFIFPSVRRLVMVLILVLGIYNVSVPHFESALFIARAVPANSMETFPAYALKEVINPIIDQNPKAVFLSIQSSVPFARDNHLHRFANVRNYYLAYVMNRASNPTDAIRIFKADQITHIIYSTDIITFISQQCHERGSECPIYQEMVRKAQQLLPLMKKVYEKDKVQIYEL